jgi:hypothetical protein
MTAPRFICCNTKKALAERGPSIHDDGASREKLPPPEIGDAALRGGFDTFLEIFC